MLASDAKSKTLKIQSDQKALALKHSVSYMNKLFKLVQKATQKGEYSVYYTKGTWREGYDFYWKSLAEELSEELTLRGFQQPELYGAKQPFARFDGTYLRVEFNWT